MSLFDPSSKTLVSSFLLYNLLQLIFNNYKYRYLKQEVSMKYNSYYTFKLFLTISDCSCLYIIQNNCVYSAAFLFFNFISPLLRTSNDQILFCPFWGLSIFPGRKNLAVCLLVWKIFKIQQKIVGFPKLLYFESFDQENFIIIHLF